MQKLYWIIGLTLMVSVTGCSMAPKYTRPESPVPTEWPKGDAYKEIKTDANAPAVDKITWQQFFTDAKLQTVIDMALKNNRDLRLAALNVERAQGMYGIQRAELFPVINANAGLTKTHLPADLSGQGVSLTKKTYNVELGMASWQIDFFGYIRSLKDAALQEFFASQMARRSSQITLISQVANAYLTLAADNESLQIARSTLDSQQAAYDLIKKRYDIGLSQEIDLLQVQTRVDSARVDVSLYTRLAAQDKNALDFLVGSTVPDDFLPATLDAVAQPQEISAGISSDVLLRRPDVLQAENMMLAANANIGAARAALFPRIALTSSIGTSSTQLSGLFSNGSTTWTFAPQITMPIFDPRAWSALTVTKTDRKIALTKYERTIQQAFKEVADALAVQGTIESQLAAQRSLTKAQEDTYHLSNTRYLKGIDNYLSVIDAQRSLYAAQQGLVSYRLAKITNQARLYAVLGGGDDSIYANNPKN
ncbi:MAG: efflux transporter outer membrane subunit [Planctomycetaceae bacterium]|nr:efflux transporter outer membrane subunit [Planctomycetaceae bacterium]